MNAQIKLLLYISLVVGILYFIQQKYDIFEIVYKNNEFIKPIEVVERLKKNKSEIKSTLEQIVIIIF